MSQISHYPVFSQKTVKDHLELWLYDDGTRAGEGEISLSEFQRHFPDPNMFLIEHHWPVKDLVKVLPHYYWPEACQAILPNCVTQEMAYRYQHVNKAADVNLLDSFFPDGSPWGVVIGIVGAGVMGVVVHLLTKDAPLVGISMASGFLLSFQVYGYLRFTSAVPEKLDRDFYRDFPDYLPAKPQTADLGSKTEEYRQFGEASEAMRKFHARP